MSAGNIAYLVMVLAAYAVFVLVLGAYWVRASFARHKPQARPQVTPALGVAPSVVEREPAA
ncbi:hypothetical protein [Phenylobacterium sp.]|uniref:hypothetical protein n=1 Tax=Phenylobacterium sp. TaxID=1871053 RepID=UPI002FE05A3B